MFSRLLVLSTALLLVSGCDSTSIQSGALSITYVVEGSSATVSFTDNTGNSQTTISGRWEHRFDAESGTALSLAAVSGDSNPVTGTILVNNNLFKSGRGLSIILQGSSSGSQSGEVEVRGFIEARTSDRVTVLDQTFVVDGQTELLGRNNETVTFDVFRLGEFIEAEGRRQSDGINRATKLKLEDGNDQNQIEVHGFIEAKTATSVTVDGRLFVVDERTEYLDNNNNPITYDVFRVGDRVEADGFARPDGSYYAEKLKLDDH